MILSFTTSVFRNNKIRACIIALFILQTAQSCDICGCSINGYHLGILPQFNKNLIGVRFHYRHFYSQHLISEQLMITGNTSEEHYYTSEIWGRYYITPRIQLFGFLPYNSFTQTENQLKNKTTGIGDVSLAGNYLIFNNAGNKKQGLRHTLSAGAGIKLPTGRFKPDNNSTVENPNMNNGSGSVDFLTSIIYTLRYGKTGINTDASYRINSTNKNNFRYGNRLTAATRVFFWQNIGKTVSLLPNAGVLYEQAAHDNHMGETQQFSGGHSLFFSGGMECYAGRFTIGASVSTPLQQHLSKGFVQTRQQWNASINYLF